MSQIELAVQAQFAEQAARPSNNIELEPTIASSSTRLPTHQTAAATPFAKVNSVVAGSPADQAGLRVHDLVTRFGNATWLNHDKLSKVAEVVSQNEGVCWLAMCGIEQY
jgi:26S proteasome non-ATPase regulatory subunit 9